MDRADASSRLLPHAPGLDGLRGVAVIAVVVNHLSPQWLPGGFLGVDLFFVLSGYLITSLLVSELGRSGGVGLSKFWGRRARRLLPALFLVLVGVAVASHLLPGWQRGSVRNDGLSAIVYVTNWRFIASGQQYFATVAAPSPLLHLWSLAIEEQFYLAWPLLVLAAWRLGRRRVGAVGWLAGALAVASALAMILTVPGNTSYLATDTRAQAILIGALAAVALPIGRTWSARSRRVAAVVGAASFGTLAVMARVVDGQGAFMFRGGFTLAAVASTGLVVAATSAGVVTRCASFAPLRLMGRVSYGVYLIHWPVIVFCSAGRTGLHGATLDGLRLAIIAVLAAASYNLVEQPIRTGRVRPGAALRLAPAAVGVVAVAVLAIDVGAGPLPTYLRTSTISGAAATTAPALPPTSLPARSPSTAAGGLAPTTTVPLPRRITLVGDSVLASLAPGIEAAANARGISVVDRTGPGCGIVTNSVPATASGAPITFVSACQGAIGHVQQAAATDGSQLIVMLSTWEAGDRLADGVHLVPGSAAWKASVRVGIAQAVHRVDAGGAHVVLLGVAPDVDGLSRTIDPATRHENARFVDLLHSISRADGLGWVDMGPLVCSGEVASCPPIWHDVRLRPDDGAHFSPAGARAIGADLLSEILAAR